MMTEEKKYGSYLFSSRDPILFANQREVQWARDPNEECWEQHPGRKFVEK